ncbi:MAG: hypothetical protein ABEJ73_01940 [Haloplanus sp.]
MRRFYHVLVHEPRDAGVHTGIGSGAARGTQFDGFWVDLPTDATVALDLDDSRHTLTGAASDQGSSGAAAD